MKRWLEDGRVSVCTRTAPRAAWTISESEATRDTTQNQLERKMVNGSWGAPEQFPLRQPIFQACEKTKLCCPAFLPPKGNRSATMPASLSKRSYA